MVNRNKSLTRGLQVLKEIMNSEQSISANALCLKLEIDKSTMSRLITTLINEGFVKYVENTKEIIYADVVGNLSKRKREEMIVKQSQNLLNEIFSQTNECSYISVYDEDMIMHLNQVDNSNRILKNRDSIGFHSPLHATAMGKVILAFSDELDISKLTLEEYTHSTITHPKRLQLDLHTIKEIGYAIDDEEYEYGLRSVAVPYFSKSGELIGALGVSGLAARLDVEKLQEFSTILIALANKHKFNSI
ncbi:IclR family transcriptional regulator [Arcobacter sp. 15-2]|uniref:IclR family transcriptional regulator n=1 Tax=Arcobacter sp. 15-2 TaxID=3374109 RepID=UPI00399D53B1